MISLYKSQKSMFLINKMWTNPTKNKEIKLKVTIIKLKHFMYLKKIIALSIANIQLIPY